VKTNSSGFDKKGFQDAVMPGDGEWAVFTTRLANLDHPTISEMNVNAIAHRRGTAVHTYLFTAGTTLIGKPMHHDISDDADENVKLDGRPAPRVLNDFTQGQPHSDVGNKYRQAELKMEKRFPTSCFPFRLLTTMWGIVLASGARSYQYFHPGKYGDMTFLDFCREACDVGMDCDREERDSELSDDSDQPARKKSSKKTSTRAGSSSPSGQQAPPSQAEHHTLAAISSIPGWKGDLQQNCGVCNKKCGWYCVQCSASELPHAIKPVHPGMVRGVKYPCMGTHKRNPSCTLWRRPKDKAKRKRT